MSESDQKEKKEKEENPEDDEVTEEPTRITRYNVRDVAGKMSFGITDLEKDKIVGAGGTVVNVIRMPGREPLPPPPPPPPVTSPSDLVLQSRLTGMEQSLTEQLQLFTEGKITQEQLVARKKAIEESHLDWYKGFEETGATPTETKAIIQARADESAKQLEGTIKQILTMEAKGEITHDQSVAAVKHYQEEQLEEVKDIIAGKDVKAKISGLSVGYIFEEEVDDRGRVAVGEMLQPVIDPTTTYKQYIVNYTEDGIDKQKTFTTEGAAKSFQAKLPKYSVSYKGVDFGFQTLAEAEDQIQDIYTSDTLGVSLAEFQSWSPGKQQVLHNQRLAPRTIKYSVTYMTASGERTAIFDTKAAAETFAADKKVPTILPAWAGGAPDTTTTTRDFALELVEDTANFLQEMTESPGTYILNVPKKIADVREDLGELLRDLTDLSEEFRWKGNMPTRSEVEQYFKDNPDVDKRPGAADSPFKAKTVDEFFFRMANLGMNLGVGYIKTMTFPVSIGLAPPKKEYPEQLVTQLMSSLITLSPADVLFTKAVGAAARITGVDRAVVQTMSYLQRMGIKGQNVLKKVLTNQALTKAEGDVWESAAGLFHVSTKQLRDTSGRLFIKIDFDDTGDVARIVDNALTDMTGVTDWTKVIDKFDDLPLTSKDTQLLVTKELQRQLAESNKLLGQLTDIDPGTGRMTRWGILAVEEGAEGIKDLRDAYKTLFNLYEENAASFGAGAAVRPTGLVMVEEIFADANIPLDEAFESVDDVINFLANNPATGADLLMFLNQPVSSTHPGAKPTVDILSEIKEANIITIRDLLKDIDPIEIKDIVIDLDPDIIPDVTKDLDPKTTTAIIAGLDLTVAKDVVSKLDTDVIQDILPRLDKDVQIDIVTDLDKDQKIAVIPILDTDVITDILPTLDIDVIIDVVPKLDEDIIEKVIPTLDIDIIRKIVPVIDTDILIKVIPTLDDDTIIKIIPIIDETTIQKIVPILERTLKPGRFDYIGRMLPLEHRRRFKKARKKRPPKKIPRSKKPESYRVMFQYITGASETKRVDARSFKEALTVGQRMKKIKIHPVEVEIEKLRVR